VSEVEKEDDWIFIKGEPFYSLQRLHKVTIVSLSDSYIDYKLKEDDQHFYYAQIDPKEHGKNIKTLLTKLRNAILRNRKVNLVLERRPGKGNPRQLVDYLVEAEFY